MEVVADKALALPPLDGMLARDLIDETRIGRLLKGFRDTPAADLDAIGAALVRLSQLAADLPQVRELDINPLLADASGIIALDARVVVADAPDVTPGGNPRFAIRPYPSALERVVEIEDTKLVVRPIRPADAALYPVFQDAIAPADWRRRFFSAFTELQPEQIARFTQIDYARAMAFVAIEHATGALLGVSRLFADPDYERAEFAVHVRSDRKHQRIGITLMTTLIDYARSEGIAELHGMVLADNTHMLDLCQHLGFEIRNDPADSTIRLATLALG